MLAQFTYETQGEAAGALGIGILILMIVTMISIIGISLNVSRIRQALAPDPKNTRACPHCGMPIARVASVCHHCDRESAAWTFHDGYWWTQNEQGDRLWYDDRNRRWVPHDPAST